MANVACPYCYNRINQNQLAYQCLGRGVPGGPKKCTKSVDSVRQELTNINVPSFPTFTVEPRGPLLPTPRQAPCPNCLGVTGVRACPLCHTPLSATFLGSKSPLIGMVGGKGAGKSVYLSVLNHELRTTVRRRFHADIRLCGDQQGGAGAPRQWLETYEDELFKQGKLFAQTARSLNGVRAPVVMEWRQPRRKLGLETLSSTVLSFYDAAGEELTTQEDVHTQKYLGIADGLVLLLDPWQLPGALERINVPSAAIRNAEPPLSVLGMITDLLRVSHQVKAKSKVKVPLAVVFAKIDAFYSLLGGNHPLMAKPTTVLPAYDEVGGLDTHEHVKAMLYDYGADDIDALLNLNYTTFRYFAVSALGTAPDYAAGTVDKDCLAPFRVEEPLLWLLSRFGAIDRSDK
ncbi:MAG: zinc ribbon domain-containing protein [Pseudonocardiales bacterium]|nr:zinc ribbon domain-containing protein [Pseudonocardiales bacterium]